jgi:hypothetical protein
MAIHSFGAFVSRIAAGALAAAMATGSTALAAARPLGAFPAPQALPGAPRIVTLAEAERIFADVLQRRAGGASAQARMARRGPLPKPPKHVKVAGWVVDNGGYLWGVNKNGKILTYHSDCIIAGSGRVDHAGNLVVACGGGQEFNGVPGNVNVYKYGNTSSPADLVLTDAPGYVPDDAFEDDAGNIYVVNLLQLTCIPPYCYVNPGNVERWSVGNQSSGALPDTSYSDANMSELQSGDIDAGGTIYVSGSNTNYAPEVDAISGGVATNLNIPLDSAGDVYVVNPNGAAPLLSVVDGGPFEQAGGTLYQYALPIAPSASPLFTDPTPQNLEKSCNPIGAGYAPGGTEFLVATANCQAVAYGQEAAGPGHWKVRQNDDFVSAQIGLFVPSDK